MAQFTVTLGSTDDIGMSGASEAIVRTDKSETSDITIWNDSTRHTVLTALTVHPDAPDITVTLAPTEHTVLTI